VRLTWSTTPLGHRALTPTKNREGVCQGRLGRGAVDRAVALGGIRATPVNARRYTGCRGTDNPPKGLDSGLQPAGFRHFLTEQPNHYNPDILQDP
jgi:hypothetical protein